MKYLRIHADVPLVDALGRQLQEATDNPTPAVQSFKQFCYARLQDPKLIEG